MKTYFLSPERSDQKTILEENRLVQAEEILIKALDSLTSMVAIINSKCQVSFSSDESSGTLFTIAIPKQINR